jgi:uncharacterized protein YkwD
MLRAAFLAALIAAVPALSSRADDEPSHGLFRAIADEAAVVERTNAERKKVDAPPLTVNPKLSDAARAHALNMAKQDKLEHTLDDKTPDERVTAAGYKWAATAENIGWNERTPKDAVAAWMDSPPHKANMLNPDYTEIGVGVAVNAKGERYWVQVFGKPRK